MKMSKTRWRSDVKLAVELFGREHVAEKLRVLPSSVDYWVKGISMPAPESTLFNRLDSLLNTQG